MKEIKLTKGKVALVDDADYDELVCFSWYARKTRYTFYAERTVRLTKTQKMFVYMHNQILGAHGKQEADHMNRNGLDNRRANLRLCNHAQNVQRCTRSKGACGYIGVRRDRFASASHRYRAIIRINGIKTLLGSFKTAEEAARAYDKAAVKQHGPLARINVPDGLVSAKSTDCGGAV